jgi:hypothetical protein
MAELIERPAQNCRDAHATEAATRPDGVAIAWPESTEPDVESVTRSCIGCQ